MVNKINCALITGATKGIGRAIAIQIFKDHGWHVLINFANDTNAANDILDKINKTGGSAELMKFDVQNKTEVDKVIAEWQENNPNKFISVLVNNAGITKDGLFMWMQEKDWDEVIAVSLKGMFNVTQSVIRPMLLKRYGRIINIVSLSGLKGVPGQTNYSAAKAGMIGATKALAQEVGRRNITVNAVAPGLIKTDMIKHMDVDHYKKIIPMKRIGAPEEVGHLVSFLASDKASYITGEIININGGLYS
jgi:3-oxoacyl-[acyl-carrier protein] reductase